MESNQGHFGQVPYSSTILDALLYYYFILLLHYILGEIVVHFTPLH